MKDREILKTIGKNIQQARLNACLTQECLAELAGIHWKTLGRIERGLFPFAITSFAKISQHLGVSTDTLLKGLPAPDAKRSASIRKAMERKRAPKAKVKAKK